MSTIKNEPLYQQIQNKIIERIKEGKWRVGDRVPSEKELMDEFHVSQITTKNALAGLADKGIVERIKGKGTFVIESSLIGSMAHNQTSRGLIGLIIPTMKTKVEQDFVNFLEQYVTEQGYNLVIKISRESQIKEAEAIQTFRVIGVDGIIIFPAEKEMYNEAVLRLTLDKFPLVLIDRYMKNISTYSVSSENSQGAFEAVFYLLNKGHEQIALISPLITNTVTEERAKGFEQAFLKKDITIDKNLWLTLPFDKISVHETPVMIKQFLVENPKLACLFTMNAELAYYAHRAILEVQKETLRQIELVTFDSPRIEGITYVQQDIQQCSKDTVNLLMQQIAGEYNPKRIFIPVNLVIATNKEK
ncbi:GntR family transcriptional regulator [Niallia circulans]|uniref:GntR family transcriptional regulator n=1 Tax=Niallia circulans TaxID=1397 RepID=A0A941GKJ2_NIACI|nr:GntR family transcriptional regulator [Niallia circulans]MCB5239575.1 GntR family transcriptional regulator [Niallia circulans]